MDFWFFWDIFRKRWKVILFVAFAVATLVGVYSKLFIRPVYRSTVSLYLGRVTETPSIERAVALSNGTGELGDAAAQLALGNTLSSDYVELVNSREIADAVDDELAKSGKLSQRPYWVTPEPVKASRVLVLNVDSYDPMFSQEVAGIYAREFIKRATQLFGVQNAQVSEAPKLDPKPISPNVPKNVGAGFAVGFLVTFLFFVTGRVLDRKIRS